MQNSVHASLKFDIFKHGNTTLCIAGFNWKDCHWQWYTKMGHSVYLQHHYKNSKLKITIELSKQIIDFSHYFWETLYNIMVSYIWTYDLWSKATSDSLDIVSLRKIIGLVNVLKRASKYISFVIWQAVVGTTDKDCDIEHLLLLKFIAVANGRVLRPLLLIFLGSWIDMFELILGNNCVLLSENVLIKVRYFWILILEKVQIVSFLCYKNFQQR